MQHVQLKTREERRVLAGHLWIFSNEIDTSKTPLKQFSRGELVHIYSSQQKFLGIGYINPNALLCVRVLSSHKTIIDQQWFVDRLQTALSLREKIYSQPFYRLVFGDGDYLPGLIIDRYGDTVVLQTSTAGMDQLQPHIISALEHVLSPDRIIVKNDSHARELEDLPKEVVFVKGDDQSDLDIHENDLHFQAKISGQKTGWFYDHRHNRKKISQFAKDKRVLDVFSYLGGWGICAAKSGACEVVCIDSSQTAIDQLIENASRNHVADRINTICDDAFVALEKLKEAGEKFDIVIIDPPAFIKRKKDTPQALQAYQRINQLGLWLLNHNGLLVSASCSFFLESADLQSQVRRAAQREHCRLQLIDETSQGYDHPVHPAIAETRYLKCQWYHVLKND